MATPAGRFVWYELMTTHPDAATAFYGSVIGWSAADSGVPGVSYTILSAPDAPVGGLMALPDQVRDAGGRPGWLGYVGVEDVDAAAKRVTDAGGHVHHAPTDIPTVGRFAVVADPGGAVFCLFHALDAADHPVPPAVSMAPGHVGWHELAASDREAAFAFYAGQFGWTKDEAMDMGPMGVYQIFAIEGTAAGGMMTRPPMVPMPFWLYYFAVPEINAAIARVKDGGGQLLNGPMAVPGGAMIAQCLDPQGAMFAMFAPPACPPPP